MTYLLNNNIILNVKLILHILEVDILKNKVEEERKKKNENQEELANIVGVSRQTIISIEKEKYNPSILLAFKISKHFNKSIEDIFIYEEESENEK